MKNSKVESREEKGIMKETENHIKMALIWGVVILLILIAFGLLSRIKSEGKKDDTWLVEAQVIKKSTTTREVENQGSEKVYLIGCEDKDGIVQTFEVTDDFLDGRFDGAEVFREIRTGKAYRFKVGWKERGIINQAGYYPSIYGAAVLTDFSQEEVGDIIVESPAQEEETGESAKAETTEAQRTTEAGKTTEDRESGTKETTKKAEPAEDIVDKTDATGLEIGGIKIEVVEETVNKELRESIEEQAKAEASESFEAEKQALEEEIASLKAQLEESTAQ